jgi:hypothetical protein
MSIDDLMQDFLKREDLGSIAKRIMDNQDNIDHLIVVYDHKEDNGQTIILCAKGTNIPVANLLLDEAKDAILHGEEEK